MKKESKTSEEGVTVYGLVFYFLSLFIVFGCLHDIMNKL